MLASVASHDGLRDQRLLGNVRLGPDRRGIQLDPIERGRRGRSHEPDDLEPELPGTFERGVGHTPIGRRLESLDHRGVAGEFGCGERWRRRNGGLELVPPDRYADPPIPDTGSSRHRIDADVGGCASEHELRQRLRCEPLARGRSHRDARDGAAHERHDDGNGTGATERRTWQPNPPDGHLLPPLPDAPADREDTTGGHAVELSMRPPADTIAPCPQRHRRRVPQTNRMTPWRSLPAPSGRSRLT